MDVKQINVLVLAYLGDSVYENYVRSFLISKGICNVHDLQTASLTYVSAKGQAYFLSKLLERGVFSDEEMDVILRSRNYRSGRHPKNCDILTYKHATALEALIGYLRYLHRETRIQELMQWILEGNL